MNNIIYNIVEYTFPKSIRRQQDIKYKEHWCSPRDNEVMEVLIEVKYLNCKWYGWGNQCTIIAKILSSEFENFTTDT